MSCLAGISREGSFHLARLIGKERYVTRPFVGMINGRVWSGPFADTGGPPAEREKALVTRPSFCVHPTRRIVDDEPIAAAITPERFAGARFAAPAPRALRDDERLYISGAFTPGELERIVAWARGGGR